MDRGSSKVTGPASRLSSNDDSQICTPQKFVPGFKPKPAYRNSLIEFAKMISKIDEVDQKAKGIGKTAGYIICINCDSTAQESIQQVKNCGKFNFDEYPDDHDYQKLLGKVLDIIARD